ncbi:unnamed protein product [Linum trigynum]|uniref:CCHC-type domain-containing protein n=1 Tax=Linum trigynum TaxID=586398 RepID=A0AAV2FRI4_9ROSI
MWGIPNHYRTVAFGKRVAGTKIGRVLEAGAFAIQGIPGHFIKTKVFLDVTQPLCSQVYVSNPLAGEFWVTLVYEFLPLLCYHCGRLGHTTPNCAYPDPVGIEHYGPELSTEIIGYRVEESAFVPLLLRQPTQSSVWVNPHIGGTTSGGGKPKRDRDVEEMSTDEAGNPVVLALPAKGPVEHVQGIKGTQMAKESNLGVASSSGGHGGAGNAHRGTYSKMKGKGGYGQQQQHPRGKVNLERTRPQYWRGGDSGSETGYRGDDTFGPPAPKQQKQKGELRRPHSRQSNEPGVQLAAAGAVKKKGNEVFRMVAPDPLEIDERKRAAGEVAGLQFDPTPC